MPVHPRQGSYHLRVPNAVGSALDGISIAATSETHTASDLHGEPSTTSKPQSVGSSSPTYAPGQFPMTTAKCSSQPCMKITPIQVQTFGVSSAPAPSGRRRGSHCWPLRAYFRTGEPVMLDNRNTISCTLAAKWTDIALPHSRA